MPDVWEVIIVGAGPAGAMAAALLAARGSRVLLVERSRWPREKVCGGCVNAAAIELLREAGLESVLDGTHALRYFALSIGRQRLTLPLPEGAAIPRDVLDQRLVTAAVARGAHFVAETAALLLPATSDVFREVQLTYQGENRIVKTQLLLAADGLAGSVLSNEPWAAWHVASASRFGVAATVETSCTPRNTIAMHVGPAGYVGMAPYADGRTHLAAALDPTATRDQGGPLEAARSILDGCYISLSEDISSAKFHGTPQLTRHRKVLGHHRVLVMGDACGYVEPFTGEGIAWALRSAREAALLLPASLSTWGPTLAAQWTARHCSIIGRRQWMCRMLRHTLRHRHLAEAVVAVVNFFPQQGAALVQAIGHQSFSVPVLTGATP